MVTGLLIALKAIGLQLLASVGMKMALERLFFLIAEQVVKSTKTTHDDEFYEEVKAAYFKYERKEK